MANPKNISKVIEGFRLIHGNRFDYSKVLYKNCKTSVKIVCGIHGEFIQSPTVHLGEGICNKCADIDRNNTKRGRFSKQFIEKSNNIHNNRYDYSKVEYVSAKTNVEIVCSEHGSFLQLPTHHLKGSGCKKCSWESHDGEYNKTICERNKVKFLKSRCIVYLIRLYKDGEQFYKFGISSNGVVGRFGGSGGVKVGGYEYEVIETINTNIYDAFHIEKRNLSVVDSYLPKVRFNGYTECFKSTILPKITL